jgi:hypothetical protein
MTLGLFISTGLEAVVLADSMVTAHGSRHILGGVKLASFKDEGYHGAVFTAGGANLATAVFSWLEQVKPELKVTENAANKKPDVFRNYVNLLYTRYAGMISELDEQFLSTRRAEIIKKTNLLVNDEQRLKYFNDEIGKLMQEFDQLKKEPSRFASFYFVAFDESAKRIRCMYMDKDGVSEFFESGTYIGNGFDCAQVKHQLALVEADLSKFSYTELVFYTLLGFHAGTLNTGVGGIPKIAYVSQKGPQILTEEQTIALINLTGAYMAEVKGLGKEATIGYVEKILDSKHEPNKNESNQVESSQNTAYKEIAEILGLTSLVLTKLYIPFTSWQARENMFKSN